MLGYISFTVLPHSMRCELTQRVVREAGNLRIKHFCVNLVIWKKNRFSFSFGNWTLCLKDKFGDDFIVQVCLKYRMGKTGLISAYIIKYISKWRGLNVNETNMSQEVERCNKSYAEMLEVKLNFFFAHCFIHYSH